MLCDSTWNNKGASYTRIPARRPMSDSSGFCCIIITSHRATVNIHTSKKRWLTGPILHYTPKTEWMNLGETFQIDFISPFNLIDLTSAFVATYRWHKQTVDICIALNPDLHTFKDTVEVTIFAHRTNTLGHTPISPSSRQHQVEKEKNQ